MSRARAPFTGGAAAAGAVARAGGRPRAAGGRAGSAAAALVLAALAGAGCEASSGAARAGAGADSNGAPGARGADAPPPLARWPVPRLSENGRAVYAMDALGEAAQALIDQVAGATPGRAPRIAFYYLTLDGDRHYLGEWVAEALATAMVQRAGGRVELYTRRRLLGVIEDELQMQARADFDQDLLRTIGKRSHVDGIVVGRIERKRGPDRLLLNAQVIAVETAVLLAGHLVEIPLGQVTPDEGIGGDTQVLGALGSALVAQLPAAGRAIPAPGGASSGFEAWRVAAWDLARFDERTPKGDGLGQALNTTLGVAGRARGDVSVPPRNATTLGQVKEELRAQQDRERSWERGAARYGLAVGGNAVATGQYEAFRDFDLLDVKIVDVGSARIWAAAVGLVSRAGG